jgi:hypothetical protein
MIKPLDRGVCESALKPPPGSGRLMGYQPRSEPDSLTATIWDRRGLLGNVAYGGNRIPNRITERAAMVTLHLWDARAQVLHDGLPSVGADICERRRRPSTEECLRRSAEVRNSSSLFSRSIVGQNKVRSKNSLRMEPFCGDPFM